MFFKSILLSGAILAFSALEVSAHAAINPALGVKGTAVRNDVQRPSNNKPCGDAALSAIDSSTAVKADASGAFSVDIENFNGGRDGSRQVTMEVDAGSGANFVAGKVTANGEAAPASTGTEQITASLPAGTTCTGGASGDLCLASFKTAGGFGNCVVVQQGAGGGNTGAAAGGNNAGGNPATGNAGAGNGNAGTKNNGGGNAAAAAGGNDGAGANNNGANNNGGANNNVKNAAAGNAGANGKSKDNNRNNRIRRAAGTRLARYVVVDRD